MLNKVWVGNIDDDAEMLFETRFIPTYDCDENYLKDALHMYAKSEPAMKRSDAVLNNLPN